MLFYREYKNESSNQWVVCIHGIGGSSTIFANQIKVLKRHFNLLLIDLRGHGKTRIKQTDEKYNFELLCNDIIKVLDYKNIKKAKFIGVSMGTLLIKKMYKIAPERIEKSILAGAITTYNKRIKFWLRIGLLIKNSVPYMWLYSFFAWVLMPNKNHKFSRIMFIREAKKMNQKEFLRWFDLVDQIEEIHGDLVKEPVNIPTLYVMGKEDYMFLETVKNDIKNEYHSDLKVIENSGHVCNVDQYAKFNQIAVDFLS